MFRVLKEAEKRDKLENAKREKEAKQQLYMEEKKRRQEEKMKKLQELELKRQQNAIIKEQVLTFYFLYHGTFLKQQSCDTSIYFVRYLAVNGGSSQVWGDVLPCSSGRFILNFPAAFDLFVLRLLCEAHIK